MKKYEIKGFEATTKPRNAKFIVVKGEADLLEMYIHELEGGIRYHKDIAAKYGVERRNVLGGGSISEDIWSRSPGFLYGGRSTDFGPVPAEIGEKFLDDLVELYQDVDELNMDLYPFDKMMEYDQHNWKKYMGNRFSPITTLL